MTKYKYVIIGGGPTGLTLAHYLKGNSVLLIEQHSTVGGCHRVDRSENKLFSEHGPRIYSDDYVNFYNLLTELSLNFHHIFEKNMSNSFFSRFLNDFIQHFTVREMLALYNLFFSHTNDNLYGLRMSVKDYLDDNNFTEKGKFIINNLCVMTDGATSERYTIMEFRDLFNQLSLYDIYKPRSGLDVLLFEKWVISLKSDDMFNLKLNTKVYSINTKNNTVETVMENGKNEKFTYDKLIIAIPPKNLVKLLDKSGNDLFGKIDEVIKWSNDVSYNVYISFTILWKNYKMPNISGGLNTPWGVVYVSQQDGEYSVLTCAISRLNVISPATGLTANQTPDFEDIISEFFRQIRSRWVDGYVPRKPDHILLHKGNYYNKGQWMSQDTAFVMTKNYGGINFKSVKSDDVYTCGPHTGHSFYHTTSIESAVQNAKSLSSILLGKDINIYPMRSRNKVKIML